MVAHAWLLREAAVVWYVFASFGSSPNMLWILLSVVDFPKIVIIMVLSGSLHDNIIIIDYKLIVYLLIIITIIIYIIIDLISSIIILKMLKNPW